MHSRENKDLFDGRFDGAGDVDGEFEGGVVLGFFQSHDGFAANANALGKFFLGPAFGGAELFEAAFKFDGWHGASLCLFVVVEEIVGKEEYEAIDEGDGSKHKNGAPFDVAFEQPHSNQKNDKVEQHEADAVGFELGAPAVFLKEFIFQSVGKLPLEEEPKAAKAYEEDERGDFAGVGVGPEAGKAEESQKSAPAKFWRDGARIMAAVFRWFRMEHEADNVPSDGDEKIDDVAEDERAGDEHEEIFRLEAVGGKIHVVNPAAVVEAEGESDAEQEQGDRDDGAENESADGFLWQAFIHDGSLLSDESDIFIS